MGKMSDFSKVIKAFEDLSIVIGECIEMTIEMTNCMNAELNEIKLPIWWRVKNWFYNILEGLIFKLKK